MLGKIKSGFSAGKNTIKNTGANLMSDASVLVKTAANRGYKRSAPKRMTNYINNGIKSNSDSGESFIQELAKNAKEGSFTHRMTANTGYNHTKKEAITNEMLSGLDEQKAAIYSEIQGYNDSLAEEGITDLQRESIQNNIQTGREKLNRINNLGSEKVGDNYVYTRDTTTSERMADYYNDKQHGAYRQKATAIGTGVTLGGLGLAHRYATGGNLTHNGNGERDIVGIPLI